MLHIPVEISYLTNKVLSCILHKLSPFFTQAYADEPTSLECINKSDLFPKKKLILEDDSLQVPNPLLPGEAPEFLGRTTDGVILLSNYRLLITFRASFVNVPIGMIDSVERTDIFFLNIYCKDATVAR